MSLYHVAGSCVLCEARCFEVMAMHEAHERLPGEPKQLGQPNSGAVRSTFMLMDGTKAFLTFCEDCAGQDVSPHYSEIWRKIIRTWMRELSEKPEAERNPPWFPQQFSNGLLCELGRSPWTEAFKHG